MATQVARWINAQTTALDWTLLLLVVSALVTIVHRLMERTRAPTTIGDQGRELQGIPKANRATVSTQPEAVEAESPTMVWKMANLFKDQGESSKNYIPIDGPSDVLPGSF